jgi:hypothetical protein
MTRLVSAWILALLAIACQRPADAPSNGAPTGAEDPTAVVAEEAPAEEAPPEEVAAGRCVRAGCSGQLCVREGEELMTTCEERPEYACYRAASCEPQADGTCGFTPTEELDRCLAGL